MPTINPYQNTASMWNRPWASQVAGGGQQDMMGDLTILHDFEELLEGGGVGQGQGPRHHHHCHQPQQPSSCGPQGAMPGCYPGATQPQQPSACGCMPQSCTPSPAPPCQPSASPATPAPQSQPGTVTQPSAHYTIGSDLSGPVKQTATFAPGQNGTVDETTRYTDDSGHWYQDQGVWDPNSGVLTNVESNEQGQNALVTTSVVNGQVVSNVSGDGDVTQCVVGYNSSNSATETLTHKDGSTQTEQTTGSNGGPWGTYQMSQPDTVVQQNVNNGGPTTTTLNLTNPESSSISTWIS